MRASSSLTRRSTAAALLLALLAPCARAFAPAAPTALDDESPCAGVTAALVRCVAEGAHDVLALDDCGEWTQRALREGAEDYGLAACAASALSASADEDVLHMLVEAIHWLRASTPHDDEDGDAFALRLLTTQPHRQRATLAFVDTLPGARDNDALQDVLDDMAAEEDDEEEYDAALR